MNTSAIADPLFDKLSASWLAPPTLYYCTSTHRIFTAPPASLMTWLSDFATNGDD